MVWPFSTATANHPPAPPSACPVDPVTRQAWADNSRSHPLAPSATLPPQTGPVRLSKDREISSIPRWQSSNTSAGGVQDDIPPTACPARSAPPPSSSTSTSASISALGPPPTPNSVLDTTPIGQSSTDENWVYPSPSSFYNALERKNRDPQAKDMPIVVPIHNAVNERVWEQVLQWEKEAGVEGSKLVSFVGKPKELSPRARFKSLIGYSAPFDRHDWLVDRPVPSLSPSDPPQSTRIRYIIDFYTGRMPALLTPDRGAAPGGSDEFFRPNLAFYIDTRPALDGYEGVRMRAGRFWKELVGEGEGGKK